MKQYNKKPEPTKQCCATCAERPSGAGEFVCPVIHQIRIRLEDAGCVQWKEAKA